MSSVISFAYFTNFVNLNISELMQIFANLEQHFYSSVEFYVIHLKNQRGENLIIVRTSSKQLDPEILVTGTVLFSSLLCKYNQ